MKPNKQKVVIFAGGETAGPVVPLLALAKEWQKDDPTILPVFFDRKHSVASRLARKEGFHFKTMPAGKLRRYWSWQNFMSPFLIALGLVKSIYVLATMRPIAVIGAGGYVQVPMIVAAWLLRIPRFIHQQDYIPSFSNKSVALLASRITVTFEKSLKDFSQGSGFEKNFGQDTKIFWTGNPCRLDAKYISGSKAKKEAEELFKLDPKWPTVLVLGGGSGAMGLNQVIKLSLPELLKVTQIIHSAGAGKMVHPESNPQVHDRYHQYEFIDRMDLAYAAADIVIARAGVGTITELAALGKVSIIIPMPNSHQEWNATYLFHQKAAIIADQQDLNNDSLAKLVRKILFDIKLQTKLQTNIRKVIPNNAATKMLKVIQGVIDANN